MTITSPVVSTHDLGDLIEAITEFHQVLPDWWYSLGNCSVSRHASCGPDRQGVDQHLLRLEIRIFDDGFHSDLIEGTIADALRHVMNMALEARRDHANDPPKKEWRCNSTDLWNAKDGCTGLIVAAHGGGIKCNTCRGWMCL